MSFSTDIANIEKILVAISRIQNYIKGLDIVHFIADDKTQDAVFRNIIIIGNSLQNISQSTKEDYPDIEFSRLIAIAKYVANDYFNEDNSIIWHFANKDLLNYKEILTEIKDKLE
jgi:uncharacterized protein with HEPN domain